MKKVLLSAILAMTAAPCFAQAVGGYVADDFVAPGGDWAEDGWLQDAGGAISDAAKAAGGAISDATKGAGGAVSDASKHAGSVIADTVKEAAGAADLGSMERAIARSVAATVAPQAEAKGWDLNSCRAEGAGAILLPAAIYISPACAASAFITAGIGVPICVTTVSGAMVELVCRQLCADHHLQDCK